MTPEEQKALDDKNAREAKVKAAQDKAKAAEADKPFDLHMSDVGIGATPKPAPVVTGNVVSKSVDTTAGVLFVPEVKDLSEVQDQHSMNWHQTFILFDPSNAARGEYPHDRVAETKLDLRDPRVLADLWQRCKDDRYADSE